MCSGIFNNQLAANFLWSRYDRHFVGITSKQPHRHPANSPQTHVLRITQAHRLATTQDPSAWPYRATPWVSELVSGQHKVYLLPTVALFLQWTQPNTPKTEKSRPNPWVNPTHGQLWLAPMSTKTRRPSSRKSRRNRSI